MVMFLTFECNCSCYKHFKDLIIMCLLLRVWFLNIVFLGGFVTMLNMTLLEWKCKREDIVNKNDLTQIVHDNVI
jgi:hypothetical protein